MPHSIRPGDVLAGRYRLVDLLDESGGARFWRAHDSVLERHVALHIIDADDERSAALLEAARRSATVLDPRLLRVLDAEQVDGLCYVVNEWGAGISLDILVATQGPAGARRAAWLVAQVADAIATAHDADVAHGRLVPENVLIDRHGEVKIIGLCVDAAMHGLAGDRIATDVTDLAGLLYCSLTGKWPGVSSSDVPAAPVHHGHALRPRRVRAGVPGQLDALCDEVLRAHHLTHRSAGLGTARGIADLLTDYVGDATGMPEAWRTAVPGLLPTTTWTVLPPLVDPGVRDVAEHADDDPVGRPSEPAADPADPADEPTELVAGEATLRVTPAEPEPTIVLPTPPAPGETDASTETDASATAATDGAGGPDVAEELPTQAGMPIFGEGEDDVSWLAKRSTPAPPPPPFRDHPERPLFAPEPGDGEPTRRPRPGRADHAAAHDDFWPFTQGSRSAAATRTASRTGHDFGTGTGTGTGRGTGTGLRAIEVEEEVPGRSWLRLAAGIAAGLLLLVAVVVAYNLGRGKTPLGNDPRDEAPSTTPTPETSASASTSAVPVQDLVASDLDPQGDDGAENPDEAPLAVDGDPTTAWSTLTYDQQFGPAGLKTGLGLVVDLGAEREVTSVDLSFLGSPTGVSLYVADTAPSDVTDLDPVASETATDERLTVELDEPATGQYVVVWLTELPADDGGGFRGEVAEIAVRAVEAQG